MTVCAGAVGAAYPAFAQNAGSIDDQVRMLQQKIQQQQDQINQQQKTLQGLIGQVKGAQAQAQKAQSDVKTVQSFTKAPGVGEAKLVMSTNNRPKFVSADGQNSIELTSIFNFDVGGYNYHPNSTGTPTQALQNGVNARRARIGVTGLFMGDWKYDFQYDFGSFDDALVNPNSTKSGLKSGYISYLGFGATKVDLGYLSVPFTLDQATANTDYMFMEHPISQALAIAVTGGDSRSAFGVRSNDDRYWVGSYLTGPKVGTAHTTGEQVGSTFRAAYQIVQSKEASLHIGGNYAHLFTPAGTGTQNLAIEPEVSIDPTAAYGVTIGSATNALRTADVYGLEAAGGYRNLFFQGEYFSYRFNRQGLAPASFQGGYLQGSWTLTGEQRKYNPESGAYGRITPANPMSLKNGGWGAFELAARVSYMNLNSNFTSGVVNSTSAVDGGKATVYTLGLNWYPNNNVMFRVNYLHGGWDDAYTNITGAPATQLNAGAKFDAIAARAQVAF